MSADCNCSKVYKLGCYVCGQPNVLLPFTAPSTGTYTAVFVLDGVRVVHEFEATIGENLLVPIGGLNENFFHRFYVQDENGEQVIFTQGATEYDCIGFKLVSALSAEATLLHLPAVTCENLTDEQHGLTNDQLLTCILPTYDFALVETLEALSVQQTNDLIAALCTGGGGPCDPLTYQVLNSLSAVLASGSVASPCGEALVVNLGDSTIFLSDGITPHSTLPAGSDYTILPHDILFTTIGRGDQLIQTDEFNEDFVVPLVTVCDHNGNALPLFSFHEPTGEDVKVDYYGDTQLMSASPLFNMRVPQVLVEYTDAAGATQVLGHYTVNGWDADPTIHQDIGLEVPRITLFLSDGSTVYGYVDVASPQRTLGVSTIRSTNGLVTLKTLDVEEFFNLPNVRLQYTNTAGATAVWQDVAVNGIGPLDGYLTLGGGTIPRILVRKSDGTTFYAWVDISFPFLTLDPVTIKDSLGTILGTADAGEDFIVGTLPCAAANYTLKDVGGNVLSSGSIPSGGAQDIEAPNASWQLFNSAITLLLSGEILSGGAGIITAPDGSVQVQDSLSVNIGTPQAVPSGATVNVLAPDATFSVRNSVPTVIASGSIRSNQSATISIPDSTVGINNSDASYEATVNVPAAGSTSHALPNVEHTDSDGSTVNYPGQKAYVCTPWGTVVNGETWANIKAAMAAGQITAAFNDLVSGASWASLYAQMSAGAKSDAEVFYRSLRFGWDAGEADTITWTVLADEAATYTVFTNDGSSGTITYSKNGGGYAALSGSIVLAASDTITLKRTTTTGAGWAKLAQS